MFSELSDDELMLEYEKLDKDIRRESWDLFIRYNQVDVIRVTQLEESLGLISLVLSISYLTKINYVDAFSPVRTWECFILSELNQEGVYTQIAQMEHEGGKIEGGYVSVPKAKPYDWMVSIDCGSMYPSIIRGLNISPETLIDKDSAVTIEKYLDGLTFSGTDYAVGANGAKFSKDFDGIVPRLLTRVLDGRTITKKEMLSAKKEKELILAEMNKRGIHA